MTQGITQTDGGVGYIELAYALSNKIPFATVVNKSGDPIVPSLDAVQRLPTCRAIRPTCGSTS